jgi:hypothetical protein
MSVTIYPDGSIGWGGAAWRHARDGRYGRTRTTRPQFELRGAGTADPPTIDIGADILNIERHPTEPARITICRQSPEDAGYREVFVSLDGENLTMLQFGESYTCEVKPGPHRLRAHNTLFWKTHHLVLRPGEHAKFTAINRTGTISFGLLFMLGAFPVYLTFERETEKAASPSPRAQIQTDY